MTATQPQPLDFAQRLSIIRRHLNGLIIAVDALERDMQARQAPQPDGERAAQAAQSVVYRQGPSEVKIIRD